MTLMSDLIKIAVDAMGGDGSPKKIIDGLIHNHNSNKENFFQIFGDFHCGTFGLYKKHDIINYFVIYMNNLNNSTSGENSGSFSVNNIRLKEMFLLYQQVSSYLNRQHPDTSITVFPSQQLA